MNGEVTHSVTSARSKSATLFGMRIAPVTMGDAVTTVLEWCDSDRNGACRYVVTPNTDHAVLFQRRADFRDAYEHAALVLADGAPLVWASRLFGRGVPERVAGSDFIPALFSGVKRPVRVFLLGAAPGVGELAAKRIEAEWPNVSVVGTYSPPLGFDQRVEESERAIHMLKAVQHDLLLVGLGAPKQELWVAKHRHELPAKVAVCAGATIDFLAGHRRRSPVWMRNVGLEWFHRMCSEPRRLAGRYFRDAVALPQLLWREWRGSSF